MKKLEHYISELLYRNDCVIIPGFGGILANYVSAKHNPNKHRFSPPAKRLSFNSQLSNNDGLLANHISREATVGYDKAVEFIEKVVREYQALLKEGKKVKLAGIGVFGSNEGKISFNPDRTVNYLPDSFGLAEIQAVPVRKLTPEEEVGAKIVKLSGKRPLVRKLVKTGIAAVLVIAIGLTTYLNFSKISNFDYSALNPFETKETPVVNSEKEEAKPETPDANTDPVTKETPVNTVETAPEIASEEKISEPVTEAVVEISEPKPVKEEVFTAPAPERKEKPVGKRNGKQYYIIGGCFEYPQNAERLVAELQSRGYNAEIIGQNHQGLHQVAYAYYPRKSRALDELWKIKAGHNPAAWLLRK